MTKLTTTTDGEFLLATLRALGSKSRNATESHRKGIKLKKSNLNSEQTCDLNVGYQLSNSKWNRDCFHFKELAVNAQFK